jgi:hypothetical protein
MVDHDVFGLKMSVIRLFSEDGLGKGHFSSHFCTVRNFAHSMCDFVQLAHDYRKLHENEKRLPCSASIRPIPDDGQR